MLLRDPRHGPRRPNGADLHLMWRLRVVLAFVTTVLVAAAGCGGPSAGTDVTQPPPTGFASVRLSSHSIQLNAGDEQRIELQGLSAEGVTVSLTAVQWTAPEEVAVSGTG